jgi:hypothetical protein
MHASEMVDCPVGSWVIRFLRAEGRPIAHLGEADLYQTVVDAAINVTSLGVPAALAWAPSLEVGTLEVAGEVLGCDAARWWSATWRQRPQIWLSKGQSSPEPQRHREAAPGKPRAVMWTSSAVAGLPSAWWPYFVGHAPVELTAWEVPVRPEARVFEIRSPRDWQWLCEQFGMLKDKHHRLLHPDWDAVGGEFDGVHLTVEGLISTQGVPVERDQGRVMLWGWDVECTAWLRWPVRDGAREPRPPSNSLSG